MKIVSKKGYDVLVTARDKEVSLELLDYYQIPYINRGRGAKSIIGKLFSLFAINYFLIKVAVKFKPDLFMSFASPYAAQVAFLLRKKHISFTDTENARLGSLAFVPFSTNIYTPNCYSVNHGKKHIKFNGYMELCYLLPKYYKPNKSVNILLNIQKHTRYMLIRFVAWGATHDVGHKGISTENKILMVKEFSKYARVFISSEGLLPPELERYRIKISPERMHDVLAGASLLYGESATMASECAVLGGACYLP